MGDSRLARNGSVGRRTRYAVRKGRCPGNGVSVAGWPRGGVVGLVRGQQPVATVGRALRGKKVKDGCQRNPPELVLGPDQRAIEARQVSANFSTCITMVEIGTPT